MRKRRLNLADYSINREENPYSIDYDDEGEVIDTSDEEELSPVEKKIFERRMQRIESVQDGRVFKFDKFENPYEAGGAEVGIFERKALINDTYWIPLFCSKRENASSCFEKLHNSYMNI